MRVGAREQPASPPACLPVLSRPAGSAWLCRRGSLEWLTPARAPRQHMPVALLMQAPHAASSQRPAAPLLAGQRPMAQQRQQRTWKQPPQRQEALLQQLTPEMIAEHGSFAILLVQPPPMQQPAPPQLSRQSQQRQQPLSPPPPKQLQSRQSSHSLQRTAAQAGSSHKVSKVCRSGVGTARQLACLPACFFSARRGLLVAAAYSQACHSAPCQHALHDCALCHCTSPAGTTRGWIAAPAVSAAGRCWPGREQR